MLRLPRKAGGDGKEELLEGSLSILPSGTFRTTSSAPSSSSGVGIGAWPLLLPQLLMRYVMFILLLLCRLGDPVNLILRLWKMGNPGNGTTGLGVCWRFWGSVRSRLA
uniref:Uncharacterized protein n=1 Tax=Physcomitrium patens TaxID=3218 RepID=A0A7I4EWE2_PHYPA